MKKFEEVKKIGWELYDATSIFVMDAYQTVETFFTQL